MGLDEFFEKQFNAIFADANAATFSAAPAESLTVEGLRKALEALPPEPFGEFMREQEYPPNEGWKMILPKHLVPAETVLPSYVLASPFITDVLFYKDDDLFFKGSL